MDNLIVIAIVTAVVGLAGFYIYKAKKSGKKCIGCPESGSSACHCSGGCQGCSGSCANK